MTNTSMDMVIGQLLSVLDEGFEGPQNPWSYFSDKGEEAGLSATIAKLSPSEASRPLGGTTISAHVYHVIFALSASSAWIKGERASPNWQESWSVSTVDDSTWADMLEQLRRGHKDLHQAILSHASSSVEAMGGSIGAIAHLAYHLGAIRQKVAFSRKS